MRRLLLLVCLMACGCETVNVSLSVQLPRDAPHKAKKK